MKYLILYFCLIANASVEIPNWVSNPITSDEKYYYGFGMAESESESGAFNEADKNAESDLIQNAFGATFQVSTQMSSNNIAVNMNKNLTSETNQVLTRNIQRDQIYKEHSKYTNYKVYILKKIERKIADKVANEKIQNLSKIHFESKPSGSSVLVDGKVLGITPLAMLLPMGTYNIKMQLGGYKPISRKLIIDTRSDSTMSIDFEKQLGSLEIDIYPSTAKVTLDGEIIELSKKYFDLKPGTHKIIASEEGFVSKEKSFVIETDKKLRLSVQLAPVQNKPTMPRKSQKSYEEIFSEKALNLFDRGKYAEIIKLTSEEAPNIWIRSYFLAMAYSELAIHDNALANIQHASEHFAGGIFLTTYCKILSAAGKYDEAIKKCDEAILDNPSNVEPYVIKARTCFNAAEKHYNLREKYTERGIDFYLAASKLNRKYHNELLKKCNRFPFNYTMACSRYN